ncbi:MAG TPA: YceI family protein [Sphingomonas sp.]|nr:YceI family protein [Sphingomonas sp.]
MRMLSAALALLIASAPAMAQGPAQLPKAPPGAPDVSRVVAGSYAIEPHHTQVMFAVDHLGFSIFRGFLSNASGTLTIDPARPAAAKLSVTVPIATIHTTSDKLNEELVSPQFFDAQRFPDATFTSTKITPGPNNMARVEGDLTIHGVTKPAVMQVHFHGAGKSMMGKGAAMGFDARMTLSRSAFGVGAGVPLVSDRVELTISAAFEQQS